MNLLDKDVLLVDKPAGMSSFGVVARVRRILTEQMRADYLRRGLTLPKKAKVGHAGTLDPFATGLLILLLGREGTRKAQEFLKLDKRYEATIRLGATSSTGDVEGEIRTTVFGAMDRQPAVAGVGPILLARRQKEPRETVVPNLASVQVVLERFVGEGEQRVPAYSAVKINGRRAYDLARKGIEVEMPVRKVRIYELELVSYEWPELKIRCKVSSGTYIRALGEDIGAALGVGGYLTELRRTEIGEFSVKDAVTLDEIMRG
ncbi:tRNA pseudouridine(55) synthase TruB [Candidatus Saccharibacteria bacterium]|nr:tRNA pseudouridine(55) synthase TruB [Candidatus Saccharibacteria bacterium]